ncbi:hypothetical protein [Okeania sp. SIO3B5]|nr:hypothetical protein [Okeania sp. SIO3B5]
MSIFDSEDKYCRRSTMLLSCSIALTSLSKQTIGFVPRFQSAEKF